MVMYFCDQTNIASSPEYNRSNITKSIISIHAWLNSRIEQSSNNISTLQLQTVYSNFKT